MAKESIKARERKRIATVARYAEKRKALKAAGDYEGLDKLPKNASPVRLHNRDMIDGRPAATCASLASAACVSAKWLSPGKDSWCDQVELVV
jgi:hypothetical protein